MSENIIKDDSRFIHGEDLRRNGKWCDITLTIKSVGEKDSMKALDGKTIEGYPFSFVETEKMVVLKGGNIRMAKADLGTNDREQMAGKRLTLYPARGDWFGQKNVCAVRVRFHDGEGKAKPFLSKKDVGFDLTKENQPSSET